jgi:integrase
MQVKAAAHLYLTDLEAAGWSTKHIESVNGRLSRFSKQYGGIKLDAVSRDHIQQFFDDLEAAGLAMATMAGYKATLRAFWRWLRAEEHTVNQPDAILSSSRHSYDYTPVQSQPANAEDFQTVLNRLDEFAGHRDYRDRDVRDAALLSVAVDSAKRRGELWRMRVRDVQRALERPDVMASGPVYRISSRGKTGQATITFFEESAVLLRRWLEMMPDGASFVWCNTRTGQRLRPESLSLAIVRICKWSGVTPFRLHAIRKRDVTDVIAAAGDPKVGQLLAGHKDPRTTQMHYNQVEQSRVDALVGALNQGRRGPKKGDDLANDFFGKV